MYTLKVKYKDSSVTRLQMPRDGDVGIDIYAYEDVKLGHNDCKLIDTGVFLQIPEGYWVQIMDRSSKSKFYHVMAGVVDTSYVGEVRIRVYGHGYETPASGNRGLYWDMPMLLTPTAPPDPNYTALDPYVPEHTLIKKGDKIAQLILRKSYNKDFKIEEVQELSNTERGENGFGSTGA
jgi:dUTP pyrophosphatase